MRLKLEDIGRLAGVSRSTVSRVVNGEQSVRPEVRSRVEAVIKQTGYAPNAAARSLVSNRTGVIGLVIPSRVHTLFEDPYFARLIQGVTLASNRAGTTLSLFLFQSEAEERQLYPRVVESGYLDGVIITATRMGDPLMERMLARGLPLVMVGRPDLDDVSYVDVDNRDGGEQAGRHLVELGYQRIGMVGAPTNTTAGQDRLDGFVAGLAAAGRSLEPHRRVDGDFSEVGGHQAMKTLLGRDLDAVFVASDTMAAGALRAIREHGLDVPADIGLVGFDGFPLSRHTTPPLTTIRQPVAETAGRAVELLIDLIAGVRTAPSSDVLPVELIVRSTTVEQESSRSELR
jgi:DNA-binding LacI/PurR family transcriptional regulator